MLNPKLGANEKECKQVMVLIDPKSSQNSQIYANFTPSIQSTSNKLTPDSKHMSCASQTNFSIQIINVQQTLA